MFHDRRLKAVGSSVAGRLDVTFPSNRFRGPRLRFAVVRAARVGSHLSCERFQKPRAAARERFRAGRIDRVVDKETLSDVFDLASGLPSFYPALALGATARAAALVGRENRPIRDARRIFTNDSRHVLTIGASAR